MASNPTSTAAAKGQNGSARAVILPEKGTARVKNVMSGDTVVLWGKITTPGVAPPQVQFTLEGLLAPRLASKNYPNEDPGAFPAREFLRKMLVGKMVSFHTIRRRPVTSGSTGGASASDAQYYHYGHLFLNDKNVALEVVANGHSKVKDDVISLAEKENDNGKEPDPGMQEYMKQIVQAQQKAVEEKVGIHGPSPVVRTLSELQASSLDAFLKIMSNQKVTCVIEYIFDGSRYRCQVVDPNAPDLYMYASFTLLLSGVVCPRCARPNDPEGTSEEFAEHARLFVSERLLQRELQISFHGTDKSVMGAVGTVHHPKGNIAVELLKNGLARMADWSVRLMKPVDVPPLRHAENTAKRTNTGVWHSYAPPQLSGASEIIGTVVEVQSGDTVVVLPNGKEYDSEDVLQKISLASIRAPRLGNERMGRADEPYAVECKERLRILTVGKNVKVQVHYERDIPIQPEVMEKRRFGTISVGKKPDVGVILLTEGLAVSQRHRDDDEKSPNYDNLLVAESNAKAAKKGIHSEAEYKKGNVNDLTEPKKAKAYSGSLMRAGNLKAVVDYVFNGARFKVHIPTENCYIMFAPNFIRCPQPSPPPGARQATKAAEPFGDASKRHARLNVLQRSVEITCTGVTLGGVITGSMHVGQGGQRRDYTLELVGAGLATVDQRKIDYGEAPKHLIDAQTAAQQSKMGIWSIEREVAVKSDSKSSEKSAAKVVKVRLSEIRSGSHFFFHLAEDEAAKVMEDSMKLFTENNGTNGAPCDTKVGKVVAALFDDGTGKSWYRAKIMEKKGTAKVSVLFLDHGNVSTVPIATHLRPLDMNLGTDRIPPVAREATLALAVTQSLEKDEGIDAARMLQSVCWGKDLTAQLLANDENGRMAVILHTEDNSETSFNEEIVTAGFARVAKRIAVNTLARGMKSPDVVEELAETLTKAQATARKSRAGMWRYGDVGEDDPDEI